VPGGSGIYESARLPNLGELEAQVLQQLWDAGGWMTTRDVMDVLDAKRQLAYTTVMTILVKLWKKGLLERTKDGRAYAYHPTLTREEWTARKMGELLSVADNRAEALSHFVSSIDQRDISQLRRILRSEN
jgi:predicted transcriptional regulator